MSLVFETQRLRLNPITMDGLDTLHRIFVDPFVRKYLCDDEIFSSQQVEEMLLENQTRFEAEKFGLWFIETKAEQEIIGFVGLWYFFDEDQPQLIYALLPTATQKGYATEAATQILDYWFNELNHAYLVASSDKPNLESHKVAERLGMKQVEEKMIDGKPVLFFRVEKS
ncbi:GNAT family N-acetyltransferase [Oculatella sp. LEGE 06141]|uniref:GNAT family N-acetyltransferase n=1 Tax=Oculatella sp. LEGE 06141 TaxID=1828648 RepID=UPI00187F1DC8|nr:GNAT family N-acetyltransferase [Oculatella sp. LEGE 06141]MBE9178757.1 GNAT family N-acetyltransferase [Oculatella sp. LEGE 06141]